jgi:hypothetical protein
LSSAVYAVLRVLGDEVLGPTTCSGLEDDSGSRNGVGERTWYDGDEMLLTVIDGPFCWLMPVVFSLSGLTVLEMVSGDKGEEKHGFSRVRPRAFSGVLGSAWLATCVKMRNRSRGEPCSASR